MMILIIFSSQTCVVFFYEFLKTSICWQANLPVHVAVVVARHEWNPLNILSNWLLLQVCSTFNFLDRIFPRTSLNLARLFRSDSNHFQTYFGEASSILLIFFWHFTWINKIYFVDHFGVRQAQFLRQPILFI